MARLTLLVACLALYFVPNPVDCETWGDITEKIELDSNIDVKLVNNNTKVIQEIPAIFTLSVENKNATHGTNPSNADEKFVNIAVKTTTPPRTEIPKFFGFQPRIVPAAPPKAPAAAGAATTSKPAAAPNAGAAAGPKTITYKLGQRVAGIEYIITIIDLEHFNAWNSIVTR